MTAWIVDGDVAAAARRLEPGGTLVDALPDDSDSFDLRGRGLVWPTVVRDEAGCAEVVEALLRGVAVVVCCDDLAPELRRVFAEELERACGSNPTTTGRVGALTADQKALLEALASGVTLATAAASSGLAVRSASRRLADARRILGVTTNAEAVLAITRQQ